MIPERVLVRQMDRALNLAEQNRRTHDEFAAELGFERVYVHTLQPGDEIRTVNGWAKVDTFQHRVDDVSSWYSVRLINDNGTFLTSYDDGERVSRKLDPINEPF